MSHPTGPSIDERLAAIEAQLANDLQRSSEIVDELAHAGELTQFDQLGHQIREQLLVIVGHAQALDDLWHAYDNEFDRILDIEPDHPCVGDILIQRRPDLIEIAQPIIQAANSGPTTGGTAP